MFIRAIHAWRQGGRLELAVVLLYACFSALWILLSDHVVERLVQDANTRITAHTAKGWLFVVVTSALLYALLRRLRAGEATASARPAVSAPVLLGAGGIVSALVAFAVWHNLTEERRAAAPRLQTVAQAQARELGQWLSERLRDAAWVQAHEPLRAAWLDWRATGRAADLQRLQQALRGFFFPEPIYTQIDVIESSGLRRMRLQSDAGALEMTDQPQPAPALLHQGVLRALELDYPVRVGPWRDDQGRVWLSFVAPLAPQSHAPAATALHLPITTDLHPALRSWSLPWHSAETEVFRVEADHLLRLNAPRQPPGQLLQQRAALSQNALLGARLVRGEAPAGTLFEGLDARGVASFGVGLPIDGTDWWLLVKVDRADVLQQAVARSVWAIVAGTLFLLSLGATLYLFEERRRLRDSQREIEALHRIEHDLRASVAHYRLLTENTADVVWLYDVTADRLVYASPSVQQQTGYTQNEMLGLAFEDLLLPQQAAALREGLAQRVRAYTAGDATQRTITQEITLRRKDGQWASLEVVSTLLPDAHGQITRILGISRDISARKRAEAQLRLLSQIVEQSPAAVLITDLQGHIEYVNPAFERMSGYTRSEVIGQKPSLLRSPQTPAQLYAHMWATLGEGRSWTGELVNRRKDGSEYVQSMNIAPVRDETGCPTHYAAVEIDVTALREAERKAHQLAWFSPVTGLPNRHRLLVELESAQRQSARAQTAPMLLLIDLDRFQTLNDALGHAAGDELLRQVGERLRALLQPNDHLAHLNADEFGVLLHHAQDLQAASAQVLRFAHSVHAHLDEPFVLSAHDRVNVSCCIGITPVQLYPGDTPSEALRRADTALHRAKRTGTRQTALFDASMQARITERFALEQDLRRGIAAQELRLCLQPQVDRLGRIRAAEALVRWQHPQQGLLPPGRFIPIAEESELIVEVDRWVLRTVCRWLGELRRRGRPLPLAINISPRHFHQADFAQDVQQALQQHGAAAADLVIEITEGIVMERMDSVVQKMLALNTLGVRFSLDDFGTGYSSLAYLKRLPIHEIKIDRSFVQDAPTDPNGAALVQAMLSVAHHLRLRVVAEGVETREQADFLTAYGDVLLQGYLYGRPEPAEELLERWLAQPPATA